jgi:FtsP/CotA-like multicopper oxidase with cupredoxin domain
MVRNGPMASPKTLLDRRTLLAGLGAAAIVPIRPGTGFAQGRATLALQARPDSLPLLPGAPATPIWSLTAGETRFRRGDTVEVAFANELPVPTVLNWRGLDGVPGAEPLSARGPLAAGARQALQLPLRHAGTLLGDIGLLGDGQARPTRAIPLVVGESEAIAIDRDEVLLIEDWRVLPDGTAIPPGADPRDARPVHTVNGRTSFDLSARANERIRLRFINGCQRTVIATKIENFEVRVMAIDGQPAEPFRRAAARW